MTFKFETMNVATVDWDDASELGLFARHAVYAHREESEFILYCGDGAAESVGSAGFSVRVMDALDAACTAGFDFVRFDLER